MRPPARPLGRGTSLRHSQTACRVPQPRATDTRWDPVSRKAPPALGQTHHRLQPIASTRKSIGPLVEHSIAIGIHVVPLGKRNSTRSSMPSFSAWPGVVLVAIALSAAPAAGQSLRRASLNSLGGQSNGYSGGASASSDGSIIAFRSEATNLVQGDTNGCSDIFVYYRATRKTERISISSQGLQGNSQSYHPAVSGTGRYVAFHSLASNLVPGDTNGGYDVFVRDLVNGTTSRVSVTSTGVQGNTSSEHPAISADGRFVAFDSDCTNLVPGDTNIRTDVFVHDRQMGLTTRVSISTQGVQGNESSVRPSISGDGGSIVFASGSSNLAPGDTNAAFDVFLHDRQTGITSRRSVSSLGAQGNNWSDSPVLSADARHVGFVSNATNLVPGDTNGVSDVFLHDLQTGITELISKSSSGALGDAPCFNPVGIGANGRLIVFSSRATNLVQNDTNASSDVFVRDRQLDTTRILSQSQLGNIGNGNSANPFLTNDGRTVVLESLASNLVFGDSNQESDVFIVDASPFGPDLYLSGSCPGAISIQTINATPGSLLALVSGLPGSSMRYSPPCTGMLLGVTSPSLRAALVSSRGGTAQVSFFAPSGACGMVIQAVDVDTCTTSNAVIL